jgi:hypothetical protein
MTEHNLDQLMMDNISGKLAKVFNVHTDHQRIDSVHIQSNMRRLGRISIFSQTINKFLVNLKRQHRHLYNTISSQLIDRYISKKALAAFSLVKPSESDKTLQVVSTDLFDLIEQFKDQPSVCAMHSYKLMQRVLNEQCNVQSSDGGAKLTVKAPKQIPSNSLQNPSDPDATYNSHKGQGYQVQIMESFTRTEDKDEKEQTLNLITHVSVQKACEHDSHALIPAIEDTQSRALGPKAVLADTLYGSDDNVEATKAAQVELIAPTFKGGISGTSGLTDFKFDDNGYITMCPAGHSPKKVKHKKKKNRYSAYFGLGHCTTCPHIEHCPAQAGKKNYYVRYIDKDYRLAVRRAMENSEAFIDVYRWRAGIESTMNQYNQLTGVKRLRVRGIKAVRYCATLKAAGLNLLRAAAVRRARMRDQGTGMGRLAPFYTPCLLFKELFIRFMAKLGSFFFAQPRWADSYSKLAA